MNFYKLIFNSFLPLIFFVISGCILNKGDIQINIKNLPKNKGLPITVSTIKLIDKQFVISGSNLGSVTDLVVKEGASSTQLDIESKSSSSLIANSFSNVTFAAGRVFNFILSNAEGASTFTVDFSLCDSTLGGKRINCLLTPNNGDVLTYDGASDKWIPKNSSGGLSYRGSFDASASAPTSAGPAGAGEYYIISVAGNGYEVGDWAVDNGTTMDRINNSSAITNVFGRTGAIAASEGDYTLNLLTDVDLTAAPLNGQALKYNGTKWIAGPVVSAESDPSVSTFAKSALPACTDGQVLKSNGTSFSCVTDATGAGAFSGTPNRAVVTDNTGALVVSTISDTILDYLSGVSSNIQTQLNSKASSASIIDWSQPGTPTIEPTRYNLTIGERALMTNSSGVPTVSSVNKTELEYLVGVSSNVQTQLNAKANSSSIVDWSRPGMEPLEPTRYNLSIANRAVVTNASGVPTASTITSSELGYLSGATSSIQTQLNDLMAQWLVDGDNLYRMNGFLGLGTASPLFNLHINDQSDGSAAGIGLSTKGNNSYIYSLATDFVTPSRAGALAFYTSNKVLLSTSTTTNAGFEIWTGGQSNMGYRPFRFYNESHPNIATMIIGHYDQSTASSGRSGKIIAPSGSGTDISGGNLILSGGGSTGSGSGGSVIFQGASPGVSGATVNLPQEVMRITGAGNVSIGSGASPTARLEVSGQVVIKSFDNGSATTFDMNKGNNQYTTASCGAMTLSNVLDGATYTLAIRGATSGVCTFSATGYTFRFFPANASTTASTHSLYSMQVMGSIVYVSWITGI